MNNRILERCTLPTIYDTPFHHSNCPGKPYASGLRHKRIFSAAILFISSMLFFPFSTLRSQFFIQWCYIIFVQHQKSFWLIPNLHLWDQNSWLWTEIAKTSFEPCLGLRCSPPMMLWFYSEHPSARPKSCTPSALLPVPATQPWTALTTWQLRFDAWQLRQGL